MIYFGEELKEVESNWKVLRIKGRYFSDRSSPMKILTNDMSLINDIAYLGVLKVSLLIRIINFFNSNV